MALGFKRDESDENGGGGGVLRVSESEGSVVTACECFKLSLKMSSSILPSCFRRTRSMSLLKIRPKSVTD